MKAMSKGILFLVLGFVATMSAFVMFRLGNDGNQLPYLEEYWFYPLPVSVIFGWLGMKNLMHSIRE